MTIVALAPTSDIKFTFRVKKETGVQRPALELKAPEITVDAIANYLGSDDTKVVSLVVESLQGVLNSHIRGFVDADVDFDQAKLDALVAEGKIGFEYIANLPRAERNNLTNQDLEEFGKVYYKLSQELLGKTDKQAATAVMVFGSRMKKVAGNFAALDKLGADLEAFIEKADDEVMADHVRAITYLVDKIAEYKLEDISADAL